MKVIFIFVAFLSSIPTLACREWQGTTETRTNYSSDIYLGAVFSSYREISHLKNSEMSSNYLGYVSANTDHTIEVRVYETLKGKEQELIKAKLKWCDGGTANLGQMVLLYKWGENWHAKNPSEHLAKTRKVLTTTAQIDLHYVVCFVLK